MRTGMLLDGSAELAASDFTLTWERASVVDFLTPLTETHLRIIIKNPSDSTNWAAYVSPLSWGAWGAVAAAAALLPLVLVAFTMAGNFKIWGRENHLEILCKAQHMGNSSFPSNRFELKKSF